MRHRGKEKETVCGGDGGWGVGGGGERVKESA